jgi:hypothetical protein
MLAMLSGYVRLASSVGYVSYAAYAGQVWRYWFGWLMLVGYAGWLVGLAISLGFLVVYAGYVECICWLDEVASLLGGYAGFFGSPG